MRTRLFLRSTEPAIVEVRPVADTDDAWTLTIHERGQYDGADVTIFATPDQMVQIAAAILNDVPLVQLLAALDDEAAPASDNTCAWCGGPHRNACPRWLDAPPPKPSKRHRPAEYYLDDEEQDQ